MYNSNYPPTYTGGVDIASRVSAVMKQVYVRMTGALLITAFISYFCSTSLGFIQFAINHPFMVMWLPLLGALGIVFGLSAGINKLSSGAATGLLLLLSALYGVSLFPIFMVYTHASIVKTFFITAGTFGAMSVYGYFTDRDLSRFGSVLIMLLFGLIIVSIVNIFMKSSSLEWVLSGVGVLIFIGLTAWDTQQVKNMAQYNPTFSVGKLATLGALSLYLDFINLFLYLLRFFGNARD
ncbi:MAG: Bax inhibitor-1/YccA family protein [Muribaculaceae bacterium]|nr:Bax inhibitor-1/YccA family protein [Muribaculaceae bacterium]